jgi:hypothetical protein
MESLAEDEELTSPAAADGEGGGKKGLPKGEGTADNETYSSSEEEEETLVSQNASSPNPNRPKQRNSLVDMANLLKGLAESPLSTTPSPQRRRPSVQGGFGPGGRQARRRTLGILPSLAGGRGGAGGALASMRAGPKPYRAEMGLTPSMKRVRERLAARYATLGFPVDGCMQVLKEASGKLDQTAKLLLFYYPKGEGVRNMVNSLTRLIKSTEEKLHTALATIQATMSEGTPAERMILVRVHFDKCDVGNKEYLTPAEFHQLSHTLGVEMSPAELEEAILEIDDDGNGQIEVEEYLMW